MEATTWPATAPALTPTSKPAVEALFLSLMAPDKSEAAGAAKLAQELAGMDAVTMEKCKAAALERFKIDAEWGLRT